MLSCNAQRFDFNSPYLLTQDRLHVQRQTFAVKGRIKLTPLNHQNVNIAERFLTPLFRDHCPHGAAH